MALFQPNFTHTCNQQRYTRSPFLMFNFKVYQMKFPRKLLGKRVPRHINIKSVTVNVQSVRQP